MTSAQLRAARALLRWTAEDLAQRAHVGVATIRRAEAADGDIPMIPATESAVRAALEGAGVEFLDDGAATGVRLRRP